MSATNIESGDHSGSLVHAGAKRTCLLHVLNSLEGHANRPLVIVRHGGGGNAARTQRLKRHGFERLADRKKFLVVYPEGSD